MPNEAIEKRVLQRKLVPAVVLGIYLINYTSLKY